MSLGGDGFVVYPCLLWHFSLTASVRKLTRHNGKSVHLKSVLVNLTQYDIMIINAATDRSMLFYLDLDGIVLGSSQISKDTTNTIICSSLSKFLWKSIWRCQNGNAKKRSNILICLFCKINNIKYHVSRNFSAAYLKENVRGARKGTILRSAM